MSTQQQQRPPMYKRSASTGALDGLVRHRKETCVTHTTDSPDDCRGLRISIPDSPSSMARPGSATPPGGTQHSSLARAGMSSFDSNGRHITPTTTLVGRRQASISTPTSRATSKNNSVAPSKNNSTAGSKELPNLGAGSKIGFGDTSFDGAAPSWLGAARPHSPNSVWQAQTLTSIPKRMYSKEVPRSPSTGLPSCASSREFDDENQSWSPQNIAAAAAAKLAAHSSSPMSSKEAQQYDSRMSSKEGPKYGSRRSSKQASLQHTLPAVQTSVAQIGSRRPSKQALFSAPSGSRRPSKQATQHTAPTAALMFSAPSGSRRPSEFASQHTTPTVAQFTAPSGSRRQSKEAPCFDIVIDTKFEARSEEVPQHVVADVGASDPVGDAKASVTAKVKKQSSSLDDSDDKIDSPDLTMQKVAEAQRRSSVQRLQKFLPEAEELLARLKSGATDGDFCDSEKKRMRSTFLRFMVPDSCDCHKEDLAPILRHLGYTDVVEEVVNDIAKGISEYASMDFKEFMIFVKKYAAYEQAEFRKKFDEFDEDGNGELDIEEIIKYISSLGYTPLRCTIREAMNLVDINGDGALQFEEVVLLMHLYRHSEGFSSNEVKRLTQTFKETLASNDEMGAVLSGTSGTGGKILPASKLGNFLTDFFGPAFSTHARELSQELADRAKGICEEGSGPPLGLDFAEVLVWARKLRDEEFKSYKQAYAEADLDASGAIDFEALLTNLGVTLTKLAIDGMIEIAKAKGDWHELEGGDQDYDSFVHFMQVLNETDGFTTKEMEEIQDTFNKFDADGSGDIDVIELGDIMRYLGHPTEMDEVVCLLGRLDQNNNGTLDFREFVRFMRMHREGEIKVIKEAYSNHMCDDGKLDEDNARAALMYLVSADCGGGGGKSEEGLQREAAVIKAIDIENMAVDAPVDMEAFIRLALVVHFKLVQELRKRAGFSDLELDRFQSLFNQHDPEGTGRIRVGQVAKLVGELGFPLRTVEDQQNIARQLDDARAVAAERGTCALEASQLDFWMLVHVLRDLFRRDARQVFDKVTRAAEQSRFKANEVAEFQEIFLSWYERDHSRFADASTDQDDEGGKKKPEDVRALSRASVLRLLRSIGLKVEGQDRENLDKTVVQLSENAEGSIEFAEFLRLMRWALDTNFCNIGKIIGSDK
mmetsp:Transcript_136702/g.437303  ORF Transcript_136702/g.437303 Transcript_136702/m.437303 type:complete len:1157 (-) Transcript_136702:90-3560(-)